MSESSADLRHTIANASELAGVVRTMKTMAAASIGQYEQATHALDDYYRSVQLGLLACLSEVEVAPDVVLENGVTGVLVFGSDQGLVGQFNEVMGDFVTAKLAALPGKKVLWVVGERMQANLQMSLNINDQMSEQQGGVTLQAGFNLPASIHAITPLLTQILHQIVALRERGGMSQVLVFHHRPEPGAIYAPVMERLLPFDQQWRRDLLALHWPGRQRPQVIGGAPATMPQLMHEHLFVSLFRACVQSLVSENASRLAAMQRAEKNIRELLIQLNHAFHSVRQNSIDAELFDVIAGFAALKPQ